ncbi:hypothetical protein HNR65_002218 [Desulfosalsimonas propionicica]|uniref:Uncharacterized protein n=1 Tax=Desulfosalsimonas propionicica TaxID=332175 RepID=A0A7W0C9Z2_9BACT|nr:hypothetical protein [Desulfosalsimonas propionicica]MBA2881887.1 hypothetical protein [Desulfosalsimonas propionicica]
MVEHIVIRSFCGKWSKVLIQEKQKSGTGPVKGPPVLCFLIRKKGAINRYRRNKGKTKADGEISGMGWVQGCRFEKRPALRHSVLLPIWPAIRSDSGFRYPGGGKLFPAKETNGVLLTGRMSNGISRKPA